MKKASLIFLFLLSVVAASAQTSWDFVWDESGDSKAVCWPQQTYVTPCGTLYGPDGGTAKLQFTYRIVEPDDLKTTTAYWSINPAYAGQHYCLTGLSVLWPGIRPEDTLVEILVGANALDPATGQPLMQSGKTFDYYWYSWVCPPPECPEGQVWNVVTGECEGGQPAVPEFSSIGVIALVVIAVVVAAYFVRKK
jgi:hypothetical protein